MRWALSGIGWSERLKHSRVKSAVSFIRYWMERRVETLVLIINIIYMFVCLSVRYRTTSERKMESTCVFLQNTENLSGYAWVSWLRRRVHILGVR